MEIVIDLGRKEIPIPEGAGMGGWEHGDSLERYTECDRVDQHAT
jgi:hypothetical protein